MTKKELINILMLNKNENPKSKANKKWYDNNKDYHNNYYNKNKEFLTSRNKYYYYNKNNRLNEFIQKYPTEVSILQERGITFN